MAGESLAEHRGGAPGLRFQVLGPLQVTRGGENLPLGTPLQRVLLAALLTERSHTLSVPALMDRLWEVDPPSTAVKSIQKYVSNLRRILGNGRILSSGGYRLVVDDSEIDEYDFERVLSHLDPDHASPVGPKERLVLVEGALALWRGEPYADLTGRFFIDAARVRLTERRLFMIEERMNLLLELGNADLVASETAELVELHPLRERLWQLRMIALATVGRQADALSEFQRLRGVLGDELGLVPALETLALEEKILLQDPSLAPIPAATGNLPAMTTRLVAREAELDRLESLLQSSRLVTVVGTAGVGKTALALNLASRVAPRYAHGAWMVGLGPVAEPERVIGRAAEALGAPNDARANAEAMGEFLSRRSALIVVDNCEHVIGAAAELVGALLQMAPHVTVVATSRQPLGVAGETVFPLDTLTYPSTDAPSETVRDYPAVELLVERAEQAGTRVALDESGDLLGEIARCLDGIPLAIELAAAQLRVLSPGELCLHLKERLGPLESGRRDVPDRQRTLEAAVEWSFRLLSVREQELLTRLSVFRGGFTFEAADRICGFDDGTTLSAVAQLVDKSLVMVAPQRDDSTRYFLLRVIRLFSEARLSESELEEVSGRHAAYFYELAEEKGYQHAPMEQLGSLAADSENLRAALRHLQSEGDAVAGLSMAAALGNYWAQSASLVEAQGWLEKFLDAAPDAPPELRTRALLELSLAYQPSSSDQALRVSESALSESLRTNDRKLMGEALCGLGRMHAIRVERDPARPLIEEALTIFEELGDLRGMAQCHEALGVALRGTPDDLAHYQLAVDLYREIGADHELTSALFSMAYRALIPMGRFAEARAALDESHELCSRHGFRHGALHASTGLGQLARLEGDLENARRILSDTLDGVRELGDRRCAIRMLTAMARVALLEGDTTKAFTLLEEGLGTLSQLDGGLSSDAHELVDAVGLVMLQTRDLESAARLLGASEAIRQRQGLLRAPPDQDVVSEAVHLLRTDLGGAHFRALLYEGSRMTLEDLGREASMLVTGAQEVPV